MGYSNYENTSTVPGFMRNIPLPLPGHCHTISERQNLSVMSGGWAPLWALKAGVIPPENPISLYIIYVITAVASRVGWRSVAPKDVGACDRALCDRAEATGCSAGCGTGWNQPSLNLPTHRARLSHSCRGRVRSPPHGCSPAPLPG